MTTYGDRGDAGSSLGRAAAQVSGSALRTFAKRVLLALGWFQLLSSLVGAGALTTVGLPIPVSVLDGSVFTSFFWPGVILGVVVGGTQLAAVVLQMRHRSWAWFASAVAGFGMVIWIFVELSIMHELHWLHVLYFSTGALQIMATLGVLGVIPENAKPTRNPTSDN